MTKRGFWGLALVLVGVVLLVQEFGQIPMGLSFWPVVLTLVGGLMIRDAFQRRRPSWFQLALGLWLGGMGLFNILSAAGVTHITGGDIASKGWPVLLIAGGISAMFSRSIRASWHVDMGSAKRSHVIGDVRYGGERWSLYEDLAIDHSIGDVKLDLTSAEIPDGTHRIDVDVKLGEVVIRVPDNVNVVATGSVNVGEMQVLDDRQAGVGEMASRREVQVPDSNVTLEVQARVRMGKLKITREPSRVTRIGL